MKKITLLFNGICLALAIISIIKGGRTSLLLLVIYGMSLGAVLTHQKKTYYYTTLVMNGTLLIAGFSLILYDSSRVIKSLNQDNIILLALFLMLILTPILNLIFIKTKMIVLNRMSLRNTSIENKNLNTVTFTKLNESWNAYPNFTRCFVIQKDKDLILKFNLNPYIYNDINEGDFGKLTFKNCSKYRLGSANDEGFYMGQCRFSEVCPNWGEFYQVEGDTNLLDKPTDWHTNNGSGNNHYLFYMKDKTFECKADSWSFSNDGALTANQILSDYMKNDLILSDVQKDQLKDPSIRNEIYKLFSNEPSEHFRSLILNLFEEEIDFTNLLSDGDAEDPDYLHENIYLCAIFIYWMRNTEDVFILWKAKNLNMDMGCMLDISCLFGAGVNETIEYLENSSNPASEDILDYIKHWTGSEQKLNEFKEEISNWFDDQLEYHNRK